MSRWLRDKYDAPQQGPGLEMGPSQLAGIVEAGTGTHGRACRRSLESIRTGSLQTSSALGGACVVTRQYARRWRTLCPPRSQALRRAVGLVMVLALTWKNS